MNPIQPRCPRCASSLPAEALGSCPCASQDAQASDGAAIDIVGDVGDVGDVGLDGADAGILGSVVEGIGTIGGVAIDVIGAVGSGIGSVAGAILEGIDF